MDVWLVFDDNDQCNPVNSVHFTQKGALRKKKLIEKSYKDDDVPIEKPIRAIPYHVWDD